MAELQLTPPQPGGRIPCPGAGTLICDANGNISVAVGTGILTVNPNTDPTTAPSGGTGFWFNVTGSKLFIYTGSAWVQLTGA